MSESKAATYDDGKPALAHLPWGALRGVCEAQAYGHKKYGDFNNYRKGMEVLRNLSCAMRHITEFIDGVDVDPESQVAHLKLAACRLLFVLQNQHDGTAIDDRFKGLQRKQPPPGPVVYTPQPVIGYALPAPPKFPINLGFAG